MYQSRRSSRSEFVPIRNLRYHVRLWGEPAPDRTPLVMLHGWMDVSASWQFVIDALADDHYVIAPDWRGFGLTDGGGADNYWQPDYLADLDCLLDHYVPEGAVDLIGHSMGGNVAMHYAGVRPTRIRRLVNLEGFGMPETQPDKAPARYGKWIDQVKKLHRGELALTVYPALDGVARRLMKTNPRLTLDKAQWLATHWSREQAQQDDTAGVDDTPGWKILGEPAHKLVGAQNFRLDESLALYRCISAPLLAVESSDDSLTTWWKGSYTLADYHQRLTVVPDARIAAIADAGHMLHHDQPAAVAALIENFLREAPAA